MIVVFLDWIYIALILTFIGILVNRIVKKETSSLTQIIVTGLVAVTAFTQWVSIFYKIGLVVHIFLLIVCGVAAYLERDKCRKLMKGIRQELFTWQGLVYVGVLVLFAFFTSRGTIHADTGMYHAQAIRWYEEYGVVIGQGNLQWHFAYNSASLAFAALFSMGFLGLQPLHCTTGFVAVVLCIWAIKRLGCFFEHKYHMTDMCCVAILFYALINACGFVSPASDYITMFMAIYLFARWAEEVEKGNDNIHNFALLSVFAAFVATLKLSSGLCVLLVVFPLFYLIKEKKWKAIGQYVSLGLLVVLPFLIRNVIISGYLLYPFPAIDIFNVDWKMKVEDVILDAATIQIWARRICIRDMAYANLPMHDWFPIWWEGQERYEQMLILTNCIAGFLGITIFVHKIMSKIKIRWNLVLLVLVVLANDVAWFLTAPFVRYGLAFLLTFPFLMVGIWMIKEKSSLYKVLSGATVLLMFLILTPYWDHYFTDDGVFLKQRLRDNNYVLQKDYEADPLKEVIVDGIIVYSPEKGEKTGYDHFPASAYAWMAESSELRGDSIKDGFRPRKNTSDN